MNIKCITTDHMFDADARNDPDVYALASSVQLDSLLVDMLAEQFAQARDELPTRYAYQVEQQVRAYMYSSLYELGVDIKDMLPIVQQALWKLRR